MSGGERGRGDEHDGAYPPAAYGYGEPQEPDYGYPEDAYEDDSYVGPAYEEAYAQEPYAARAEPAPARTRSSDTRRSHRVSKRVLKRRRTLAFLIVLVLFVAVVAFVVQSIKPLLGGFEAADYPGPGTGTVEIMVPAGSSARSVATLLMTKDVVASEQAFVDALEAAGAAGSLQPGTFALRQQMTAADAVAGLLAGDSSKVHYAALPQNLRLDEALAVLATGTGLPIEQFTALSRQPATFGLPAAASNLEGYLAPGEYRFPIEMTAQQILQQLVDTTVTNLAAAGVTQPVEQYRILTIASIIEFEGTAANYAEISGAIENRINNPNGETHGFLQSDATVVYGLGIKSYNLTPAQKDDASNLYNTYANPGLPVGPIGSPGAKAIAAAAAPQENPYYFWVTIDLHTGETLFATTYAQHLANVEQYIAWCGDHPGECEK